MWGWWFCVLIWWWEVVLGRENFGWDGCFGYVLFFGLFIFFFVVIDVGDVNERIERLLWFVVWLFFVVGWVVEGEIEVLCVWVCLLWGGGGECVFWWVLGGVWGFCFVDGGGGNEYVEEMVWFLGVEICVEYVEVWVVECVVEVDYGWVGE